MKKRKFKYDFYYATTISSELPILDALVGYSTFVHYPWTPPRFLLSRLKRSRNKLGKIIAGQVSPNNSANTQVKTINIFLLLIPFYRKILKQSPPKGIVNVILRISGSIASWKSRKSRISMIISDLAVNVFTPRSNLNVLELRWMHPHFLTEVPREDTWANFPTLQNFKFSATQNEIFLENLAKFQLFVTYSEIAKESYVLGGIDPANIMIAPLTLKSARESKNHGSLNELRQGLLFVGRGSADKNLDLAVAISVELGETLFVAGTMSESIANWLKKFDNVVVLGELDSSAVLRLMLRTEVLLALGVETFGFAIVEAATSGMKVVTTRFAGASSLLGGWEGVYLSRTLFLDELATTTRTALMAKTPLPFEIPQAEVELSWKRIVDSVNDRERKL